MKNRYTILILVLLTVKTSVQAQSQTFEDQKINVVNEYLKAAFLGDTVAQSKWLHPEVVDYHTTILRAPSMGKKELIEGWRQSLQLFETIEYQKTSTGLCNLTGFLNGEWVVTYGMVKGKSSTMEKGISYQMTGFYKVENGLIMEIRNFGDSFDIYSKLGYTVNPPKQPALKNTSGH